MGRKQKVCAALICLGLLTGTTAVQAATADAFRTEEYNRMGSLEYIHAAEAYAKGYSGKGVILGIRDGIVRQANGNFTGKTFLTPYTYTDDYPWEKSPHGSHVAGTMAANKDDIGMHGVAYAADLMSLNSLTGDVTNFTFLMQYPQVKVVNNSIGIDYYLEYQDLSKYGDLAGLTTFYQKNKDNTLEAVSAADFADYRVFLNNLNTIVNNDKLFVFAASNEGHLSSSLYTAVGNFYNVVNKNNILSVEACSSYPDNFTVDGQAIPRSNGPVFFSNLAMFTEDISLVAPGFQIGSTTATTTDATKLTYFMGTSMATPHVTGALGLVQEAYPYLSAKQLGDVVLSTTSAMTVDTSKPFYTLLSSSNDIVSYGLNLLCYDNRTKPTTPEDWKALILEATGYTAEQYEALLKKCNLVDGNNNILYNNFYFYNNVPKSVAFGQGLLNADLATNGLGALNAKRLAAADVDNTYAAGNGGKQALYKVNTAGYNSVWSNAISETRVLMPGYGVNQDADLADRQSFYRQYAKEQQEHHSEPLMKNKEAEIENYIGKYNAELAANPLLNLHVGLYKEGQGILRLTGANTYQGSTVAAGGTLTVDGSVAGDAYSTGSGTLGGIGTINGNLYNQGILRPGTYAVTTVYDTNPAYQLGTLNIKGNLNSTGTLQIAVQGTDSSKLAVSGSSTLTGSRLALAAGYNTPLLNHSYNYLNSQGGIKGNVTPEAVSPYVTLNAQVAGNSASFTANQTAALGSLPGMTHSENSVGAALNRIALQAIATEPASAQAQQLNDLLYQDEAASRRFTRQVTGEARAQLLSQSPMSRLTSETVYSRLDVVDYSGLMGAEVKLPQLKENESGSEVMRTTTPVALDSSNNLWLKLFKGFETYNYSDDLKNHSFGGAVGYDHALSLTTRVGGLFSYGVTNYSTDNMSGDSHDWRVGAYVDHKNGNWDYQGLLTYGHNKYDLDRYVLNGKVNSDYQAKVWDVEAKAKYLIPSTKAKTWQLTPYGKVSYTHTNQDAYSETGSSIFAQNLESGSYNSTRGEIGLEFKRAYDKHGGWGGSVGYKRVLSGVNPELNGTFAGEDHNFTIRGDNDRNFVTYSLNVHGSLGGKWTGQAELRGEASQNTHKEIISVAAKYSF